MSIELIMTEELSRMHAREKSLNDKEFSGFTPEQQVWVETNLEVLGLPLSDVVTKVSYKPNEKGTENVLGTANRGTGEFSLYKRLEKPDIPEIGFLGTMAHEAAHFSDPFLAEHSGQYGEGADAIKNQEAAREHAEAIATQTDVTRVYLTGYHKRLHQQLLAGEINKTLFAMETHAIMTELRFTNPNKLKQVQESQKNKLSRLQENGHTNLDYTQIVSADGSEPVGIDKTLISLMDEVNSVEQLENHVAKVRDSYSKSENPFKQPKLAAEGFPFSAN